jgi:ABC-type xylose transport system permease subunit
MKHTVKTVAAVIAFAQCSAAVTGSSAVAPMADAICEIFGGLIPTAMALMMAAYAALLWIYSQEDPAMRERAKTMFVIIAAGIIIVNIAKPLVKAVFPAVGDICP